MAWRDQKAKRTDIILFTHTPSPMGFLNELLDRPAHERPYLLLVVGCPAEDAQGPAITKKTLAEFVPWT